MKDLRKNTLTLVSALFLTSSTMMLAHAEPVFEIGVGAFGQYTISSEAIKAEGFSGTDALNLARSTFAGGPANWGGEISISLNTFLGELALKVNPIYAPSNNNGTSPLYEGTLRGNLLGFIQLQELMVRRNALNLSGIENGSPDINTSLGVPGDSNLAMLGLGPSLNLPLDLGQIAISLGVAYAQYQYAISEQKESGGEKHSRYRTQNEDMVGAYLGTHLKLRFWRVENELYAAYYMDSGTLAQAVSDRSGPRQSQGATFGDCCKASLIASNGGFQGFNVDNTTFIRAVRLPIGELGPELRIRLLQMPQGEEFTARLGLKIKATL
jgi:hypothetical protein